MEEQHFVDDAKDHVIITVNAQIKMEQGNP